MFKKKHFGVCVAATLETTVGAFEYARTYIYQNLVAEKIAYVACKLLQAHLERRFLDWYPSGPNQSSAETLVLNT